MATPCLVTAFMCVAVVSGQWPLPPSFYASMNQLNTNMANMRTNLQSMGQRIQDNMTRMSQRLNNDMQAMGRRLREEAERRAAEREAHFMEYLKLAENGTEFGLNGKIFTTVDGGLGYAYNSSDGSMTMYVIRNSNPPHGFMHHIGINGNQMYNSW